MLKCESMNQKTNGISAALLTSTMEQAGLSAEQFARIAGVTRPTVRAYEDGLIKNPRRSTVRKLRDAIADIEQQMKDNPDPERWA